MQVGMYYWKTCVSGGCHGFHENVLWKDMCSRWACLAGLCRSNHLSCCDLGIWLFFFLSTVSFVCSETCFPRIYCLNILLGYVGSFMWSSWLTF